MGLSKKVRFLGGVPHGQLGEIYRRARAFLLTSHYEGFGRVVVESYLHRVPVVAPAIGGVEDIVVPGETGYLHAPGDVAGMANSLGHLLADDGLCERMGRAGANVVRSRFDPETLTRRWIALLVETARGNCR